MNNEPSEGNEGIVSYQLPYRIKKFADEEQNTSSDEDGEVYLA